MLFRFVLSPHSYSRGARPQRLPLSGSCTRLRGCAITHAAQAALATLGRAVGSFFIGYRTDLRARSQAVSPRCSCPRFARLPACSIVRRIPTLFVGYRHKIIINHAAVCDGGCLPPSRSPRVFFIVLFCFRKKLLRLHIVAVAPIKHSRLNRCPPIKKKRLIEPFFVD